MAVQRPGPGCCTVTLTARHRDARSLFFRGTFGAGGSGRTTICATGRRSCFSQAEELTWLSTGSPLGTTCQRERWSALVSGPSATTAATSPSRAAAVPQHRRLRRYGGGPVTHDEVTEALRATHGEQVHVHAVLQHRPMINDGSDMTAYSEFSIRIS
jgi:hypothetical protein